MIRRKGKQMMRFGIIAGIFFAFLAASSAHAQDNNPFSGATRIDVVMTRDAPAVEKRTLQQKRVFEAKSQHPETCTASEYGIGDGYHGKRAADGSIFNTYASAPYTVAHRTRRLGSYVHVTNLATGLSIRAKVTDRGPYYHARCIDVGRAGALAIGMRGLAKVTVR